MDRSSFPIDDLIFGVPLIFVSPTAALREKMCKNIAKSMGALIVFWVVPDEDILSNCFKPLFYFERAVEN
jgi:hypothetical protein